MRVYIILIFIANTRFFIGQNNQIDLSNYCPSNMAQYKSTCYAYAVVYTAFSTEYNIKHNITDSASINTNYFSPGVVASYHNSSLPFYSWSPFCGRNGIASISLTILKNNGVTMASNYKCDCKKYSIIKKEIPATAKMFKITDDSTYAVNNKYSENSVYWIKSVLQNNHPVIIGLYQNNRLHNYKGKEMDDILPDAETLNEIEKHQPKGISNHVICILGYNDNYKNGKGYFLLKNNFKDWGNGKGFCWVPYSFILPLIHEAYFIKGLQPI